jgi:epoxyqueuosine reductase
MARPADSTLRFDHKDTILSRGFWDGRIAPLMMDFGSKWIGMVPPSGSNGHTELDFALRLAGWAVDEYGATFSEFGVVGSGLYNWEPTELPAVLKAREAPLPVEDPAKMARAVKKAARLVGADLVGIAEVDPRWIYSHWFHRETKQHEPNPLTTTDPYRYAVVMAVEMDYDLFSYSPDLRSASAAGLGYSKMAEVSTKLAAFIKGLGYRAVATGNDTGISVPLAIDAGLGEQGRAGWLVTEEFGPRARLCKVFTDLPLEPDRPRRFGVEGFCKDCMRCAEACPAGCITEGGPAMEGPTDCNFHSVYKYYMDPIKCFSQWAKFGTDCGICIRVCPWNKPNTLFHKAVRSTLARSERTRGAAIWADQVVGYGRRRTKTLFE